MSVRFQDTDMSSPTLVELLRPFAHSIAAKVEGFKKLESQLTKSQKARFRESISDDIKKCSNFITPEVSRAALNDASSLGVDLRKLNWHNQPKFDPGRRKFQWEHVIPVSSIRDECQKATNPETILEILKTRISVAWILKSEDAQLTGLGYRFRRPPNAYKLANIELIERDLNSG